MIHDLSARYRQFARWIFAPAVAVVVWGELKPSAHGPENGFDKVLHFTAYFGLAGIATVALGRQRPAVLAATGLAAFGGAMEIVQSIVGRDAEWGDELANIAGVCAGLGAALLSVRAVEWIQHRIAARQEGQDENVR